jgi:hypothetical protein
MNHMPAILAVAGGLGLIFMGFGFFGFLALCCGMVLSLTNAALPQQRAIA